jgi:hypothetical protein
VLDDVNYTHIHISPFTSLDSYLMGIFGAFIYKNYKIHKSKIFNVIFKFIYPIGIFLIASGFIFGDRIENNSIKFAIYSTILRKLWAILILILIIGNLKLGELFQICILNLII